MQGTLFIYVGPVIQDVGEKNFTDYIKVPELDGHVNI